MSGKLAEMYVEVEGRLQPLDRSLAEAHRKVSSAQASLSRGASFSLAGLAGGVAGAFALYAGVRTLSGAFAHAIELASNLAESVDKTGRVFGKSTKVVTAYVDTMAKVYGAPKAELLDAAAGIGLIAKGAGLADDAAAKLSVQMAGLAADASSLYNTTLPIALEKIRAGLVGESEPLRAFGVMLNEDAVKAEALRLGLLRGTKTLTESAKVQARASLIARGLATAQGNLADTSAGHANQTRELAGRIENAWTKIGESFLGAATKLKVLENEIAIGLTASVNDGNSAVTTLADTFNTTVDSIANIWMSLGDLFERGGTLIGGYAAASAKYVYDSYANYLTMVGQVGANLGKNLAGIFLEVRDYVTSWGKDPIKIEFVSLLDGVEFKRAKLDTSAVDAAIEEIDTRIMDRALARQKKIEELKVAAAKPEGPNVPALPDSKVKAAITSSSEYSHTIQKAASDRAAAEIPKQQLAEQKVTNKRLEELARLLVPEGRTQFRGQQKAGGAVYG
jgi:hypothetical protein